jgi:hypothetical protein
MSGTNVAVSFFSSQWGQMGKVTFQVFPPGAKNIASTLIIREEHLWHREGIGTSAREAISRPTATSTL